MGGSQSSEKSQTATSSNNLQPGSSTQTYPSECPMHQNKAPPQDNSSECPMHQNKAPPQTYPSECPMHQNNSPPSSCPMHQNDTNSEEIDPRNMVCNIFFILHMLSRMVLYCLRGVYWSKQCEFCCTKPMVELTHPLFETLGACTITVWFNIRCLQM